MLQICHNFEYVQQMKDDLTAIVIIDVISQAFYNYDCITGLTFQGICISSAHHVPYGPHVYFVCLHDDDMIPAMFGSGS